MDPFGSINPFRRTVIFNEKKKFLCEVYVKSDTTFGDLKQMIEEKTDFIVRQSLSSRNYYGELYDDFKDDSELLTNDIKKYGAAIVMGEEVEFEVKTAFFTSIKFKGYETENVSDLKRKVTKAIKWTWDSMEKKFPSVYLVFLNRSNKEILHDDDLSLGEVIAQGGDQLDAVLNVEVGAEEGDDYGTAGYIVHEVFFFSNLVRIYVVGKQGDSVKDLKKLVGSVLVFFGIASEKGVRFEQNNKKLDDNEMCHEVPQDQAIYVYKYADAY